MVLYSAGREERDPWTGGEVLRCSGRVMPPVHGCRLERCRICKLLRKALDGDQRSGPITCLRCRSSLASPTTFVWVSEHQTNVATLWFVWRHSHERLRLLYRAARGRGLRKAGHVTGSRLRAAVVTATVTRGVLSTREQFHLRSTTQGAYNGYCNLICQAHDG